MKKLSTTLLGLLAALVLMAPAAYSQTADGQTPADETVCDPLKADGVTKGLYGLCVAFCEAQDFADLENPITEAEYEALEDGVPSGRILTNYNRKKTEADPPMPCVVIEEPCPCWTSAELTELANSYDGSHILDRCWYSIPPSRTNNFAIYERPTLGSSHVAQSVDNQNYIPGGEGRRSVCIYADYRTSPGISRRFRTSPDEWQACSTAIRNKQLELNMQCQEVN